MKHWSCVKFSRKEGIFNEQKDIPVAPDVTDGQPVIQSILSGFYSVQGWLPLVEP
jgi:hypothetical protein